MTFKGIDWTELSNHFGILEGDYEKNNETVILEKTRGFLFSSVLTAREKEVAEVLREFLQKLYNNSNGIKDNAPIWKGLLEIKGDCTLIKYSGILLEHMWY